MSFGDDIKRFQTKLDGALDELGRQVGIATRRSVASRTPVLTGRAAASWRTDVNEAVEVAQPETYFNPSSPVEDGVDAVEEFTFGDNLIVSNSLPYIEPLNSGSSAKAPAGFIEATTGELPAIAEEAARQTKAKFGL